MEIQKKSRYNQIMKEQKGISEEIQKSKIGKEYEVLIEDKSFDGKYLIGRTMQDVPEIDGLVYIKNEKKSRFSKPICEMQNHRNERI